MKFQFPLLTIATAARGHAGQPGFVFSEGWPVLVTVATNLPQGGYFVADADHPDDSIHIDTAELSEVVKLPDLDDVTALINGDDDVEGEDCDGPVVKAAYEFLRDFAALDSDTRRKAAILHYLACDNEGASPDDVDVARHDDNTFEYGRRAWLVLDDGEADAACAERIEESVWAFNADFLAGETGIDADAFKALSEKSESGNDAVLSIIKGTCGLDEFVESARSADGRGHFLSGYDGEENESGDYYIYRTN